ncbi:VIT domain-containing protein [Paraliomyxa miuraensis]|uniref:VIT domain-containing protein n=1 Tax=Paraliomyxa miuraensis TaxID=376150 RepID=UPI00224FC07E|nr:VIT domain-containing protein [Paraliomyxa miuraensis]MCX4242217.1 VIT domain-containing protein [Paraliomyxa miuraensis]
MRLRRVPVMGLVFGVLAVACAPLAPPALELELPEDDGPELEALAEPELAREEDPPAEPTTELDSGDALPTEHCSIHTGPAKAQEVSDPNDPGGGRLLTALPSGKVMGLPLRHTSFDAIVVGTMAETTVVQRFENPLSETIEVVYTFPLPHDGAVDDYWIRVGERTIRGEIHRRKQAREIYDEAKETGHTAGLLEQERPNVFTQHVANVAPGEAIEVSMHVVQPLRPDRGRYELVLPTVVGPRYVPGTPLAAGGGGGSGTGMVEDTDAVPDASRITPPILPPGFRSCGDLEIEVSIDAGGPITALSTTSHRVTVEPDHLGAMVHLDERYALLNRDFVLSWRRDGNEPRATLQAQPDGDGGYLTLTIQPPAEIDDDDVPGRELVFVVDASGSMMGEPMDMAKATMRRFIEGLRPDDAFQVLRFSETASGLGTELLDPTPANVTRALEYIDTLQGEGGTVMTEGIKAALSLPRNGERLRYVVFLTDGYIGNEREVFELIAEELGDARLFSLGVGSSVNRYLLDGMARMGRGAVTYVDLSQPTEPVVERIYEKLRHPALVDLEVEVDGLKVHELVPDALPDLFVGEPVVLFGRYDGPLKGKVVVRGRRGQQRVELPVELQAVRDEDTDGVRSMWARQRIDDLQFDPSLSWATAARKSAVEKEVIALSLGHRVLTEHTAFVAVDRTRVVDGHSRGKTVVQGVEMPAGVAHESVWGHVGLPPSGTGGAIGSGSGGGTGSGYGRGSGVGFGGRGKRVPQVRQAKATVTGSLDAVIIRRIVRAHLNEVRHCYNQGLIGDPSLSGRVVIQFVIDALGNVAAAVVTETELADPEVGKCIAQASKRWRFPKAEGGNKVIVRYPFVLSPG